MNDAYPPARHVLRDLDVEIDHRADGTAAVVLPFSEYLTDASGTLGAGVLATLVDVAAGGLAARAAAPDWIATADLSLSLPARTPATAVTAEARVARAGRTTVVVEVGLRPLGGAATVTFAVLPRRDANPSLTDVGIGVASRFRLSGDGAGFTTPFEDAVGIRIVDTGAASVEPAPYNRNTMGTLHGGIVAAVGISAAEDAAAGPLGGPGAARDLQIVYLAPARTGPVTARARLLGADDTEARARVGVYDGGGRRSAVAHVTVVAA